MAREITIKDLNCPISEVSGKRLFTKTAKTILEDIEDVSHGTINSISSCALKQKKISDRQIKTLVEWYNQELA